MMSQGTAHKRPNSLLVHIAFHFVPHRWKYLERVLVGLGEFEIDQVSVVIDSNTNDVSEYLKNLSLPKQCSVRVDVHTNLSHPFNLTWAHRKHMEGALESFDYFMYLEDDIHVPWRTFAAWLRRAEAVSRKGFIHGFLRIESDLAGNSMSSDWRRAVRQPVAMEIDGVKYIRPEWFYQACWVYSRSTMQRFVGTAAWTRGCHPWSSVIRAHRHSGASTYAREFSAFGMACASPGRARVLLPVDDDGKIPTDAWVWHLPNNYAQGSDVHLLEAGRLVEGGLGSRKIFNIGDRTSEARKWAVYLLRVDEALQFLRNRAKRLLR